MFGCMSFDYFSGPTISPSIINFQHEVEAVKTTHCSFISLFPSQQGLSSKALSFRQKIPFAHFLLVGWTYPQILGCYSGGRFVFWLCVGIFLLGLYIAAEGGCCSALAQPRTKLPLRKRQIQRLQHFELCFLLCIVIHFNLKYICVIWLQNQYIVKNLLIPEKAQRRK